MVAQIETWRRAKKWSARGITHEPADQGIKLGRPTVTRHLAHRGLSDRRSLDPGGDSNREPADGQRAGCVFCVAADADTAKLRILLVHPLAPGLGVGSQLVDEAGVRSSRCLYMKL